MQQYIAQLKQGIMDRRSTSESLVPFTHIAQQKLFLKRGGVEFYPAQDDEKESRKKFIEDLVYRNMLRVHLDRVIDYLLATGSVLFYLFPTTKGYRIRFYHKEQFKAYLNEDDEIEAVVIIYSWNLRATDGVGVQKKWTKFIITADKISRQDADTQLSFDDTMPSADATVVDNHLGFVPCAIADNYSMGPGTAGQGVDEFTPLAKPLAAYELTRRLIRKNRVKFMAPSLVTTRDASEVKESVRGGSGGGAEHSVATASGYMTQPEYASRSGYMSNDALEAEIEERIPDVIGGVEDGERFGYIQATPVSGDVARSIREDQETIRLALGGADELGVSYNATALEIKSIFARPSSTAAEKALSLYTYGLCKIIEFAIAAEEQEFKRSIILRLISIGQVKVPAGIPSKPKSNEEAAVLRDFVTKQIREMPDSFFMELIANQMVPDGTVGLPPLGDRTVQWRFLGEVFPDSPSDTQTKSIVGRNLTELGVDPKFVMRTIYPDKTDREIELMQGGGGFPFRTVERVTMAFQNLVAIHNTLSQIPDPMFPGQQVPLSARLGTADLLSTIPPFLKEAMTYGREPDFATPAVTPSDKPPASATDAVSNATGITPAFAGSSPDPTGTTPNDGGTGPTGYPNSMGVQDAGTFTPPAITATSAPAPGSTVTAASLFRRNFPTFSRLWDTATGKR